MFGTGGECEQEVVWERDWGACYDRDTRKEKKREERMRGKHRYGRTFSIASSASCPSNRIPKTMESPLSKAGWGPKVISKTGSTASWVLLFVNKPLRSCFRASMGSSMPLAPSSWSPYSYSRVPAISISFRPLMRPASTDTPGVRLVRLENA